MLKILNTDRYINTYLENNLVVPTKWRVYDCVRLFVNEGKGELTYSSHSKMDLILENSFQRQRNVELKLFDIILEFEASQKNSPYDTVNYLQYFSMKVKDIVDLYLLNHTNDELKEEFEKHEITFLRNIIDVETTKSNNLICMFNSINCRIVDTNLKEKYNQTNFGNRYVLFGNPQEIISSMEYRNTNFSIRNYLSKILSIDTIIIKHLLSIYFQHLRCIIVLR